MRVAHQYLTGDNQLDKYTVVLLLPDYVAGQYGETYCAHVDARGHSEAAESAQEEARDNTGGIGRAKDFLPVFVAAGHHDDLGVL